MDISKPVEIAKDIYWVGYVIPNDPFQCHVYLIKNGNESILIDPGSMITFPITLSKITSIIDISDIKYIILHHQDPDIVGCVSTLESLIVRDDLRLITHWRAETLLKHYQWKTPFWLVDKNNWELKLSNGRTLEFIPTPYAHFAGAFCTYDKESQIVFSSDLFGGLTDEFSLYAKGEEYFESLKLFHVHYMPSKYILNYALDQIQKVKPKMIAPQHGSIIKEEFIEPIIKKMRDLDCGLYMLDSEESDLYLLNKADELLKKFFNDIITLSSFDSILNNLFEYLNREVEKLEKFYVYKYENSEFKLFYEVGKNSIIKNPKTEEEKECSNKYKEILYHNKHTIGKLVFHFADINDDDKRLVHIFLKKIIIPFSIIFAKEISFEDMEEKAHKDELTSLYNRAYMDIIFEEKIQNANRAYKPLSIAMLDIDFFKKINDTYGHLAGDCILKAISKLILNNIRESDITIRYGGEEILLIFPDTRLENAYKKVNDLRKKIEDTQFCDGISITISAGVYQYSGEDIKNLIYEADKRLYKAKKSGRNRVEIEL